jgi:thymidylate kinase
MNEISPQAGAPAVRDEATLGSGRPGNCLASLWDLIDRLNSAGIAYCYWKSSRRVAAVLAGESDLDLLVGRPDQHRIQDVLSACGFKLFPNAAATSDTATLSYIGFDEPSGRLTHVHLHMRLTLGAKLLPNYRPPWERGLLARAMLHPFYPIRVLSPADEAVLLAVRACLELRRVDPVVMRHWGEAVSKFATDHDELARRLNPADLRARAAELMGDGCADLVADAFCQGTPLNEQRQLRRHIRRDMAAYRVYGRLEAGLRGAFRFGRAVVGVLNRQLVHAPRPWRRCAPGGGLVVALLGVDGSGKSTALHATQTWLSQEVDTMPVYFGTGDGRPSLALLPLKLLVPLFNRLHPSRPKGSSHGAVTDRPPDLIYTIALALWASVLAWEKRSKLRRARRGADRGLVVIADRYPQDQILTFNDGPLLPRLQWIPRWLRRFEQRSYALARQLPPDLLFKLRADPDLLARREPTMKRSVIEQRVRELDRLSFPGATVVCLDASEPAAEVARAIRREIWRLI